MYGSVFPPTAPVTSRILKGYWISQLCGTLYFEMVRAGHQGVKGAWLKFDSSLAAEFLFVWKLGKWMWGGRRPGCGGFGYTTFSFPQYFAVMGSCGCVAGVVCGNRGLGKLRGRSWYTEEPQKSQLKLNNKLPYWKCVYCLLYDINL